MTVSVIPVSATTESELHQSQVDLVIMPRQLETGGMHRYPNRGLFTDRYVAAVWQHHREVGDRIDRHDVERLRYVRYYSPSGGGAYVDIQLAAMGIRPEVALSTHAFTLVPWLLPGTALFAFVHERLLRATSVRRELRVVECDVPLRPIEETMYWHPVFHNDPAHHWLRECVATLAANL